MSEQNADKVYCYPKKKKAQLLKPTLSETSEFKISQQAGTKVGPDKLRPPVRVGSTRIDLDQLGSNKKIN